MNELALFAGAGGGILGGKLLGWRCVCAVEWDAYAASVLVARQNDGCLEPFPIWDDVRTFDGRAWRGRVDVVSGGFPCQDISCAGKGVGIDGERSGMWVEMARIIGEVGPRYVLVENSPMLTVRGLGRVLGDLVALGYDAIWGVLGADDAGLEHPRKRIWIMAYCDERAVQPLGECRTENQQQWKEDFRRKNRIDFLVGDGGILAPSWRCEGLGIKARPLMRRSADGVAYGVDRIARIARIGNGQVPAVVRLAWRVLQAERNRTGRSGT